MSIRDSNLFACYVSALVLLDLSAAFDTVDHGILLQVLIERFGVENLELYWFRSYHTGRAQSFTTPSGSSARTALTCSLPQDSVIGPKEFVIHTEDIKEIINPFIVNHHLNADDSMLLAHMLSRVDYCKAVCADLPVSTRAPLQQFFNAVKCVENILNGQNELQWQR